MERGSAFETSTGVDATVRDEGDDEGKLEMLIGDPEVIVGDMPPSDGSRDGEFDRLEKRPEGTGVFAIANELEL